ncbi:DUF5011 domain-containing protein [Candidatus Parcubacteria bacterium]|nr:MAG: DUF5011 domain-containing protein [Candidatus Parcubacteria bacterium]
MKNIAQKGLTYFTVFTVILWNIGASSLAVNAENLDLKLGVKTPSPKITICHANGDGTFQRLNVSENATAGHFENNGTPAAGHEDDLWLGVDNEDVLQCPTPPPTYCDTAEYVFTSNLGVVGNGGCYLGTEWSAVDNEMISLPQAGSYEVYAQVERSEANEQLSETFTLTVASTTSAELPDNEEAQQVIEQYAGNFYFKSGENQVTMTSTAQCPPDVGPNSVRVLKLCLNPIAETVQCGNGIVEESEQCDDGNLVDGDGCSANCTTEDEPEPYLTVKAHKIVCDDEMYLPNWGDGSGPSKITATTATDYVAQMSDHCQLVDNWSFQWGVGVPAMPGDYVGPANDGWLSFNSVSNGVVPAQVDIYRADGTIKIRENLQEGYVPFSYTPGEGSAPGSDVSAEIYCDTDVLNYDNYDFINGPQFGQTYYCVAFNALVPQVPEEPAPWCSALRGILTQALNTGTYSDVADMNDDELINLSDVSLMAQLYAAGDDAACYDQFEDPTEVYHFSCQNYQEMGWCDAIVQGVTDMLEAESYDDLYDLNGDSVINLTDWSMAVSYLTEGDQVACYANFVPPLPEMDCSGTEYSAYCGDGDVNQDWEQCDPGQDELSTASTQIVGCSEQCQFVVPQECTDLTLAKIHVNEVLNWQGGDMTSDLYLGSESYVIPHDVWFPLYWNGNYFLDSDLSNYEDVPGLAVQRLADSLRVVMHGSGGEADKEHIDGQIEFYNANVGTLTNDTSNAYPNSNSLENGFNGSGVKLYNAGNDEVWVADNMSHYWLTTTTADDGYYTNWSIVEDCEENESIPYAPWCSALLGIVSGAINNNVYNDVADLNDDEVVDLTDIAMISEMYAEADDELCYQQFEDPTEEYHWSCENLEDVDWCGGLYQGLKDSLGSHDGDDNYFFVFDLNNDHGDGTYGDGAINLSDVGVMASYLVEPVDQYQCYRHYQFFSCEQEPENTPPVITLLGDATVYVNQGDTYVDAGATASDNEDGDISEAIVAVNPVDTSTPGTYTITYNVSDSAGAPAVEVTRIVVVQSQGGGDPICGNQIPEEGEDCDGSAPEGYQCIDCNLVQNQTPPPSTPPGGGGGGGRIWPPTISNVDGSSQCQATTLTWDTSGDSVSWIVYGTDEDNLDQEYKDEIATREHSIALSNLLPGTTYYYTIKAENRFGINNNAGHSFTTPPAEVCGEVLGEKIEEEPTPSLCDFVRPSGSHGPDKDTVGVFTYPDGSLIRNACDHSMGVYAIVDQMKYHIPNWQYLHDNYFGKRIYNVSTEVFDAYPDYFSGQVAGTKAYADGTLLRGSDHKVYIIDNGKKRHIASLEELKKYAGQEIVNVSDEVLAQY